MKSLDSATRSAAVAGLFYPRDASALVRSINEMLAGAKRSDLKTPPKAIIAPHAGYIYSGPIAASVYALIEPLRSRIRRVLLLGPTHRVAVRGLALPGCTWFETPLGRIPIDEAAVAAIRDTPQVTVSPDAHELEHSLEVHLPFLQTLLSEFKLLPLAVGYAEPAQVAEVLDVLWGGDETLIVVSSDLSHYLAYREAQEVDRGTAQSIIELRSDIDHEHACGATPVAGLAITARQRGLRARLIDLRNSGDTAGDKGRVVGYGAFAFYEDSAGAK